MNKSIWITLGPIIAINAILFISYLIYQLWGRKGYNRKFAGAKDTDSKFLSSATREWWLWTTDPIVKFFVKIKMGPNALTATGFLFAALAAYLFSRGLFGYAGWAMILGGSFDIFDGRVARITGKTSRSGAFFDAVMDRFGEGLCFLGLAVYFRSGFMLPIIIVGLIGSLLVSYTKARAEGVGVECNVGTMQRPERIVYLGVAAVFDPIVHQVLTRWWAAPPPLLVMLALIFIAIMTSGTAIYRMLHTMSALDIADRREKESIPQIISKLATQAGREEFWDKARYGYDRTHASFEHVVLFLVGGITQGAIHEQIRRGNLPNICAHMQSRGCGQEAVGAFPSATGPASVPFVTGCLPGTCDIPGTRWFDRTIPASRVLSMNRFRDYIGWGSYAMDHDLSKSVRTIFEYSRQAVNIFGMLNRGCGIVRYPAFFSLYRRFHKARSESDIDAAEEAAFSWFSSAIKRETDFVLYYFPPVEFFDASVPDANLSDRAMRKVDDYIGRAADFLKTQGMYDNTALLLASTHGSAEAKRVFDLKKFLSKRHRTFFTGKKSGDWRVADMIAQISGSSMAHMYVKCEETWGERTFIEDVERRGLVGALLEEDGVDIIAGRSVDGGIVIQSRRGRAHVLEDADGRITYITKGGDPFGYGPMPRVLDAAQVLDLSFASLYPDGIFEVLQLFRSRRTGDLVLSAASDVSLAEHPVLATSGSLAREHLMTPVFSSVPINGENLRSADVFAFILDMLGIEAAHAIDGCVPSGSKIAEKGTAAKIS